MPDEMPALLAIACSVAVSDVEAAIGRSIGECSYEDPSSVRFVIEGLVLGGQIESISVIAEALEA